MIMRPLSRTVTASSVRATVSRRWRRENVDRWAPWLVAAVLFALYFATALLRAHSFEAGYDLGYFRQAAHLLGDGKRPFITIRALPLFADHAYFLMIPIGWLSRVAPPLSLLLGLQAASLAIGVVPLWHFGRRCVGTSLTATSALLIAYAFYPATLNINSFDFHPEVLAIPPLLSAIYFGWSRRWVPYLLSLALVLLAREDLAVVVAFLGLSLVLTGNRRAGVFTAAAGGSWFLFTSLIFMPSYTEGEFNQVVARYAKYGDTTVEVFTGLATQPGAVLRDLATQQNGIVVVALLGPLLFLSLSVPRLLLPGVPLQLLYLISNVGAAHTIDAQYTVGAIPFVFCAAACALGSLEQRSGRSVDRSLAAALVAASVLFSLTYANPRPWQWVSRDDVDQARLEALSLVPDGASVSATPRFLPYAASREELYAYPMPFAFYDDSLGDGGLVERRKRGVDYVLLDTSEFGVVYGSADEVVRDALPNEGFERIYDDEGIQVYAR